MYLYRFVRSKCVNEWVPDRMRRLKIPKVANDSVVKEKTKKNGQRTRIKIEEARRKERRGAFGKNKPKIPWTGRKTKAKKGETRWETETRTCSCWHVLVSWENRENVWEREGGLVWGGKSGGNSRWGALNLAAKGERSLAQQEITVPRIKTKPSQVLVVTVVVIANFHRSAMLLLRKREKKMIGEAKQEEQAKIINTKTQK